MLRGLHPSWSESISAALSTIDIEYLNFLQTSEDYFPRKGKFFNAFTTLSKGNVKYILFGQDPYPREQSATGYAFIDGAVDEIFSDTGLSKPVNKATSLRNFVKMLLVADKRLNCRDLSQKAITDIDKNHLIETIDELRDNFEKSGVLLLNAALVFTDKDSSPTHIKQWRVFLKSLLNSMEGNLPTLILFGTHAKDILKLAESRRFNYIILEHPYNHSFVCNKAALELFGAMSLLSK